MEYMSALGENHNVGTFIFYHTKEPTLKGELAHTCLTVP